VRGNIKYILIFIETSKWVWYSLAIRGISMNTPKEALDIIVNSFTAVGDERIPLSCARGRVMSAPSISRRDLPPGNTSFMDGYAFRRSDTENGAPFKLTVNGVIAAGDDTREYKTPPGTCWRIMTGAIIPPDADYILMLELTDNSLTEVNINSLPDTSLINEKGSDARVGDIVDHTGERLATAHMAELAARGIGFISVYRKPRVAVLGFGSEIAAPDEQDAPLKIFDANSVGIKGILEDAGCEVSYQGVVRDDEKALSDKLASLASYDLIVTSGGTSTGDFDFFSKIPEKLGIKWDIFHLLQRPAKPLCFGKVDKTPIFSLPGAPVGSVLCTLYYVRVAAKILAGYKNPFNKLVKVRLAQQVDKPVDCIMFKQAYCELENGVFYAYPRDTANYSLKTLASSNCFLVVDNGHRTVLKPGAEVDALFYDPYLL
jgi:molybdopterin molybdotransferase